MLANLLKIYVLIFFILILPTFFLMTMEDHRQCYSSILRPIVGKESKASRSSNSTLDIDSHDALGEANQNNSPHCKVNSECVAEATSDDHQEYTSATPISSRKGGKRQKRFVGVRQRPSGRWVAEIKDSTQKIRLWLGTFDSAEDAARAYDDAARVLRGANTRTNFAPSAPSGADPPDMKAKSSYLFLQRLARKIQHSKSSNAGAKGAFVPHSLFVQSLQWQREAFNKQSSLQQNHQTLPAFLGFDPSHASKLGIYGALTEKLSTSLTDRTDLESKYSGLPGATSDNVTTGFANIYGRNPCSSCFQSDYAKCTFPSHHADVDTTVHSFGSSNIRPSFVVPSTSSIPLPSTSNAPCSVSPPEQLPFPTNTPNYASSFASSLSNQLIPSATGFYHSCLGVNLGGGLDHSQANQQDTTSFFTIFNGNFTPARLLSCASPLSPPSKNNELATSASVLPSFNASTYAPENGQEVFVHVENNLKHRLVDGSTNTRTSSITSCETQPGVDNTVTSSHLQPTQCSGLSDEEIMQSSSQESNVGNSSDSTSQDIPWSFWDQLQLCTTTA